MSGRAGRRGIDERGRTILMLNKKMDVDVCKDILNGKADPLFSTFHLSYNMLVNLMRVEGIDPNYIIKRSFHQFQSERQVPQMKKKLKELYMEYKSFNNKYGFNSDEDKIKEVIDIQLQIEKYNEDIGKFVIQPENILPYLIPGRLIKVKGWGWGICVNFTKKKIELSQRNKKTIHEIGDLNEKTTEMYFVDILLYVKNTIDNDSKLIPGDMNKNDGLLGVIPIILNSVENVSSLKVNLSHDLKDKKILKGLEKLLSEILKRFKNNLPILDPIKDIGIKDEKLLEIINKVENLQKLQMTLENCPSNQLELYKDKQKIINNINNIVESLQRMKEIVLKDDLKNMKRVLKRLDFINKETVALKGQVACQISTSDEILLTEMLFNGSFNNIEPNYLCAMLSCFLVNEGGNKNDTKILKDQRLSSLNNIIKDNAGKVADVLIDCRININKVNFSIN